MKNKSGLILAFVATIVVVGCFFATSHLDANESDGGKELTNRQIIERAQKDYANVKDDERKALINISVDEYLDIINGEEKKVVFLGSSECGFCKVAQPIVENVAFDYDLDIYYLDSGKFSSSDKSRFISSNELFKDGYGTPMLLVIAEHEIYDYIDGISYKDYYINFLTKNEFIKKGK